MPHSSDVPFPLAADLLVAQATIAGRPRRLEPVSVGLPLPRGMCRDCDSWGIERWDGSAAPFQAAVLDRWSDGSIRWVLLDFQATVDHDSAAVGTIRFAGGGGPAVQGAIATTADANGVRVDTGAAVFSLSARSLALFAAVRCGGAEVLDASRSRLRVRAADGRTCEVQWQDPTIELAGPVRVCVRADGRVDMRDRRIDVLARVHFFAGLPVVRFELTLRNPGRAEHPGGIWELGDPGSTLLQEVSIEMARVTGAPAERVRWSAERGTAWAESGERVEIYQESSGGEHWQSRNHVDRSGEVPLRFRGYRLTADGCASSGARATPALVTAGGGVSLGASVKHFWENFPKSLEASRTGVKVSFFPSSSSAPHELQGGEQKTHDCWLLFGPDTVTADPLEWCRSPLRVHAAPAWYANSGAVPYLTPAADDKHAGYLGAGELRDRRPGSILREARKDRRIRLAPLRRHPRRSRGCAAGGPRRLPVALQQPVRRRERLRQPVPPERRRSLVERDGRTGAPRGGHRHLPHRPGQAGLQRRALLAHVPLRGRRTVHPSLVSESARRLRRRAVQRTRLLDRPARSPLPDGFRPLARGSPGTGRVGPRHGRRAPDRLPLAGARGHRPGEFDRLGAVSRAGAGRANSILTLLNAHRSPPSRGSWRKPSS